MRPAFTRVTRHVLENFTPSRGKHRAGSLQRDRRYVVGGSIIAGCTAVAITLSVATGAGAIGASADEPAIAAAAAIDRPAAQPDPIVRSSIVAADGASAGPVTGGTVVTVTGNDLSKVATVSFGGNPGTVTSATADTVTITTPPATDLATGTVPVELFDITGKAVKVDDASLGAADAAAPAAAADPAAASASAAASSITSLPDSASAPAVAATPTATATPVSPTKLTPALRATATAALTFDYVPDPQIAAKAAADAAAAAAAQAAAEAAAQAAAEAAAAQAAAIAAQTGYVLAHWQNYNTDVYGSISGNDCVNFTSQGLIARGWTMDGEWSYNGTGGGYSAAWSSSTAFASYLSNHPERATALSDAQRDQVKVGDIVQFDWDNSGDRDHTATVTRVDKTASGTQIFYGGHTNDTDFKSVDESVSGTGGSVSYWSVA